MTLSELAEKYGESIDNLSMDILMEAIYNERNASTVGVLHQNTNLRTRKKRKKTASMQKAEQEHQKFLKRMGYTPKEERDDFKPLKLDKLWDNYDNRVSIPTSDKVGNGLKTSRPTYTGNAVIGQAYNKGGLQVLSTEEVNDPMTGKRR